MNNIPEIITLDSLQQFKNELLTDIKLNSDSNNIKNSIVQLNANKDLTADIEHPLKVKDSVIFGVGHEASAVNNKGLINVFIAGKGNKAITNNQTIFGTYNKVDQNAVFMVGVGSSEQDRHNIITASKTALNLNNLLITTNTDTDIQIDTINEDTNIILNKNLYLKHITDIDSFSSLQTAVSDSNLADNALVPGNMIKQIVKSLASIETVVNDDKSLVQDLTYSEADADKKALSVAAGQQLEQQIKVLDAKIKSISDSAITYDIDNKIKQLKQQISYLLSCLTVDKISTESEDYYAVGLANFALDSDTKFKLADTQNP
jgi:hypothetical protein